MFKLVVLCAFVASAVAEPSSVFGPAVIQPYGPYSTVISPGLTSYSSHSSSVIHPSSVYSPYIYSHFIKKRSADPQYVAHYNAQYNLYPYGIPTSSIYQTPITYTTGAHIPLGTHLIKKRSAEPSAEPQSFIPTTYYPISTYISNGAVTPYLANPYLNSYYSPSAYPLATHFIKKRSAEPTPKAAPEASADPGVYAYSSYPTYYSGATYYPTYNPIALKSSPFFTGSPFVFSNYIKK